MSIASFIVEAPPRGHLVSMAPPIGQSMHRKTGTQNVLFCVDDRQEHAERAATRPVLLQASKPRLELTVEGQFIELAARPIVLMIVGAHCALRSFEPTRHLPTLLPIMNSRGKDQ